MVTLFEIQTPIQLITLEGSDGGMKLYLDGFYQFDTETERHYHGFIATFPMVMHGAAERVLILGGGDALALRDTLKFPVTEVFLVELDPEMIRFASKPPMNQLNATSNNASRRPMKRELPRMVAHISSPRTMPIPPLMARALTASRSMSATPGAPLRPSGGLRVIIVMESIRPAAATATWPATCSTVCGRTTSRRPAASPPRSPRATWSGPGRSSATSGRSAPD